MHDFCKAILNPPAEQATGPQDVYLISQPAANTGTHTHTRPLGELTRENRSANRFSQSIAAVSSPFHARLRVANSPQQSALKGATLVLKPWLATSQRAALSLCDSIGAQTHAAESPKALVQETK